MDQENKFIPADPALLDQLLEHLGAAPVDSRSAAELLGSLRELKEGRLRTVTIGTAEETRPAASNTPGTIRVGELEITLKSRRVLMGGREVSLTPKEFDILYFLAENRGEVFTKEQIYKAVWSEEYLLDDSNIMAFIRKLRKKIEPDPDAPRYIQTIWGIGYKFNDEV